MKGTKGRQGIDVYRAPTKCQASVHITRHRRRTQYEPMRERLKGVSSLGSARVKSTIKKPDKVELYF